MTGTRVSMGARLKAMWIVLQGGADASSAADPLVGLFLGEELGVSPNYPGMAL